MIGDLIEESKFLDLYAGVGTVGIEALSRGAKEVVFVEKEKVCIQIIRQNLFICNFLSRSRIYQENVLRFLPYLLSKENFHFIFVGPPYFKGLQGKTLNIIIQAVRGETCLIVQHSPKEKINFERERVTLIKQKRYGDTFLTFLQINQGNFLTTETTENTERLNA